MPTNGESIPYPRRDRRADLRHGRRDGRKQVPGYTDLVELIEQEGRVTTPYQEQLSHCGRYEINEEFRSFLRRTAGQRDRLGRLRPELAAAEQALDRAGAARQAARAELTDEELLPRNPHELAVTDPTVLRSRRTLMRERRIAAAQERYDRCLAAIDELTQQITEALAGIDREFVAAQARGRRHGDFYVLRIAAYWDALARTHPEGRHLATLVPKVSPTLPPWVTHATCVDGVIALPPEYDDITRTRPPEEVP